VKVGAVVAATAVGVAGAALVADNASADREEAAAPTATARPVPVLVSGPPGSALSEAVSLYAVTAFSDPIRGLVLTGWGAAFSDLFDDDVPGAPGGSLVDDPRLRDRDGEPAFTDPCADAPDDPGCPDEDDAIPASVLGDSPLGPNAALVYAYPQNDADLADECAFGDVADDELPIAVITANPGEVEVTIDGEVVTVESDEQEVAEFDEWRDSELTERPPASFVAHCIAVPRPPSTSPVEIAVVAVDDDGQVATAATTLLPAPPGRIPATVTPIDGTMVRVDIPLPAGTEDAEVRTLPVGEPLTPVPPCDALPPVVAPTGWRTGTSLLAADPVAVGERPYLDGFPRVRRITVPLPEGEPSLLCVIGTGSTDPVGVVVTPPDARRLQLAVTEVDADDAIDAGQVVVSGTFAELGWTPCGATLPAAPSGTSSPGDAGRLCASAGDSGAIAAAGGVLDLGVHLGDGTTHEVRLALSAAPGGAEVEAYRVPIPAAGLEGVLCTSGTEQPGCIEPEGDAVLGTLLVTATWTEGPIGPSSWSIAPVPIELAPPPGP
jgi:hypothetical protein